MRPRPPRLPCASCRAWPGLSCCLAQAADALVEDCSADTQQPRAIVSGTRTETQVTKQPKCSRRYACTVILHAQHGRCRAESIEGGARAGKQISDTAGTQIQTWSGAGPSLQRGMQRLLQQAAGLHLWQHDPAGCSQAFSLKTWSSHSMILAMPAVTMIDSSAHHRIIANASVQDMQQLVNSRQGDVHSGHTCSPGPATRRASVA